MSEVEENSSSKQKQVSICIVDLQYLNTGNQMKIYSLSDAVEFK